MNENNAVTKEELKEILTEMAKELRAETAAQFEEFEQKTAARFDATDRKMETMRLELLDAIRAQGEAQDAKIEMASRRFEEYYSKLLTGMDKVVKELDNHRVERLSLGAAQNRLEKQIEAIAKHLGIENSNGDPNANRKGKKPRSGRKRKLK
jgi:hypothetical protein